MRLSEATRQQIKWEVSHFSRTVASAYMGAWVFTNLNPMVGGMYGAVLYATVKGTMPICAKKKLSKASQLLFLALRITAPALVVMKAMGLPLSAITAMKMISSFFLGGLTLKLGSDFIAKKCGLIKPASNQQVAKKEETAFTGTNSEDANSSSASNDDELVSSATSSLP